MSGRKVSSFHHVRQFFASKAFLLRIGKFYARIRFAIEMKNRNGLFEVDFSCFYWIIRQFRSSKLYFLWKYKSRLHFEALISNCFCNTRYGFSLFAAFLLQKKCYKCQNWLLREKYNRNGLLKINFSPSRIRVTNV